ncbi:hypothetical protein TBLA_0B08630 [Henningerozyma blattae CBS 6284]|uniref:Malate dehydrogenase n=1 Tax=Henningerozyma blattae (strain ATCC 34711 / CBS 6284 / DSM 70876 / NBRC 10599 / NRRL Y-10934 / UCD 77-7) TaxID=1071380 RepID=I2GZX6_HENB6|nr:hypothetical protein TBLA_0B08630 [Tetrapisispora blattae CBS 6284]CCH59678.1 hypothetical protein TBLA_0B08630 [Tetrapisispora blattae CBS 6284]
MPVPTNTNANASNQPPLTLTVIGAAGGIGQSLSLLLKTSNYPTTRPVNVNLFDVNTTGLNGVATDLSHMNTQANVKACHSLQDAVTDADLIVIVAGVPRKPGMTRDDLFNINAGIIKNIATNIRQYSRNLDTSLFTLLISNPVNSLLPVLNNVLPSHAHSRCLGITNLDLIRASEFLSELLDTQEKQNIPVIGGHSGNTIVPCFSYSKDYAKLSKDQIDSLIHRVQYGGDEVVQAKNGQGSATLSMAFAAFKVIQLLVPLVLKKIDYVEGAFYLELQNDILGSVKLRNLLNEPELNYFAAPCKINYTGTYLIDYSIINGLNQFEKDVLLPKAIDELKGNAQKGERY